MTAKSLDTVTDDTNGSAQRWRIYWVEFSYPHPIITLPCLLIMLHRGYPLEATIAR